MEPLHLTLPNGNTVSGDAFIPAQPASTPQHKPLIVALHGGTMTSQYFNATASTTAANPAKNLGIPFIALDRPGYGNTTAMPLPPPQDSSYFQEEGKYLHSQILPAIWKQHAQAAQTTCIVLLGHSMACPSAIVAAALYATTEQQSDYILGGIMLSGWGSSPRGTPEQAQATLEGKTWGDRLSAPLFGFFSTLLYGTEEQNLVDLDVREHAVLGKAGFSFGEACDGLLQWQGYWEERYGQQVKVPVLYAMGELDGLWEVNESSMEKFVKGFTSAKRVDSNVIKGAPHCMEVSRSCRVWYDQCFQFAKTCADEVGEAR